MKTKTLTYQQGTLFWIVSLLLFITGCTGENERTQKDHKIIAKAYQYRLSDYDLNQVLGEDRYSEDSAILAQQYIDQWIVDKVMLHHAAQELSKEEQEEVAQRTKDYQHTLLVNRLEQKLIDQRLDTVVSEKEIMTYYNKNQKSFQLKGLLVKVMFLKLPANAPDIDKVKRWYLLRSEKDSLALDNYAKHYALNYYFDDKSWLYLDDLKDEVPLQLSSDRLNAIPYTTIISDSSNYFFVHIFDQLEKDATSPVEIEKNKIKKAILTQRMHNLRKEIKKEIIESAYENNAIEK